MSSAAESSRNAVSRADGHVQQSASADADAVGERSSEEDVPNECEVSLSITARSKEFRLLSRRQLLQYTRSLDGVLYRKGTTNEYHMMPHGVEDRVVVFAQEPGERSVITQMHKHFSYQQNSVYHRVSEVSQEYTQ